MKKTEFKLAYSLIMILICLALIAGATFAWTAQNRRVDANNAKMQITSDLPVITDYKVYRYDRINDAVEDLVVKDNVTAAQLDGHVYKMSTYDLIIATNNKKAGLVFAIKVYGNGGNATFTVSHSNQTGVCTSDICYLQAVSANTAGSAITTTNATTIFNTAIDYFADTVNRAGDAQIKKFVNGESKNDSISFTVNLKNGEDTVYLLVAYDDVLVKNNRSAIDKILKDKNASALTGEPVWLTNDLSTFSIH